jgi:prepilin-type N-terminal cleavage/methylation domain-containing protein
VRKKVRSLLKKEQGFTLIEIVLVLAIAGLILLMVFLAVSGAQKSRRDTQRKEDLSRIAAQIESYASNTQGCYPQSSSAACAGVAVKWSVFTGLSYITNSTLNDPTTGSPYTYDATMSVSPAGTGHVSYMFGTFCSGQTPVDGYSVYMGLENGTDCVDNH